MPRFPRGIHYIDEGIDKEGPVIRGSRIPSEGFFFYIFLESKRRRQETRDQLQTCKPFHKIFFVVCFPYYVRYHLVFFLVNIFFINFDNKLFFLPTFLTKFFFLTFVATNYFLQFNSSPPPPRYQMVRP